MNNEKLSVSLFEVYPLMKEKLSQGGSVVFKPHGISMLPLLRQGIDSVIISPFCPPLKKNDIPLFMRDDKSFILHRVVRVNPDGTYLISGDNQIALEDNVKDSQIIGVVSGIYRGNRLIPVSGFKNALYCRFILLRRAWRKSFPRRAIFGVLRRLGMKK